MSNLSCRALAPLALTGLLLVGGCGSGRAAAVDLDGAGRSKFAGASATRPVVVELFQSQGCSSCPPANAYLNAIADRPDILALSFAVTYWDQLGWKDTFGSPRFTERQQDYARAGRGQVATPEIIVNGRYAVVGSNRRAFDETIAKAGAPRGGPEIAFAGTAVRLGVAGPGIGTTASDAATVWLVRYDPGARQVPIRAGENEGRTLPHRGIVRQLVNLGVWAGASTSLPLPPARERGLATAVLIQRGAGGPIIAARKL